MANGWAGVSARDPKTLGFEARHPWRFQCPSAFCYWSVSCDSEADAIYEQEHHKCPYYGGTTRIGWSVTKTLVAQMWELLDNEMSIIMEQLNEPDVENSGLRQRQHDSKIRARALAECLAIFMEPFFETADEIAAEALRRFKGGGDYATPGLGQRRYERPGLESKYDGWYKSPDGGFTSDPAQAGLPANKKRGGSVATVAAIKMTEAEQKAVRFAVTSGFTIEQVAKTYGVNVAVIKAVIAKGE